MYKTVSKCRLCGGAELASAFDLGVQHLTGVFPKSVDEPITAGPVELVKCMAPGGCGLAPDFAAIGFDPDGACLIAQPLA